MTVTQTPFCNPVQWHLAFDSDADEVIENNIGGGPITLHALEVVNTGGGATDVHIKVYDATSAIVGTTDPTHIFLVKATTTRTILLGLEGDRMDIGLCIACVQEGGTAGVTPPGGTVTLGVYAAA